MVQQPDSNRKLSISSLNLLPVSVQLHDLSDVFLSTDVQFLRSSLSQPGGSIQAISVPSGMVRTFKEKIQSAFI